MEQQYQKYYAFTHYLPTSYIETIYGNNENYNDRDNTFTEWPNIFNASFTDFLKR